MITVTTTATQDGDDAELLVQIGEKEFQYSNYYAGERSASDVSEVLLELAKTGAIDLKCTDEATSNFIFSKQHEN